MADWLNKSAMTESSRRLNRFALFTNGSDFSYLVTQTLLDNHLVPELIILPQYGPAESSGGPGIEFATDTKPGHFEQLIESLPKLYAPRRQQGGIVSKLNSINLEYILVACWPYLLGTEIRQCAAHAALNIHPSYLPDHRGPDPIRVQLNEGTEQFGVSLHLLSQAFDSGDIVLQKKLKVPGKVTRKRLESACALEGVNLFARAMETYEGGWELLEQPD